MSEEEKEICIGRRSGKTYNKIQEMAKEIVKLRKELEEKTTILMAGADKVKQLEKENTELKEDNSHQWEERCRLTFELEELKEENIILEGNKIGYKLAIQELEKTIDLIIDDFQAENYFVGMTNKEVREYYKRRKKLKE